jgi:microcystin-dependent protein
MPNVSLLTSGIGDVNQGGSLVPTGTVFAFAGSTAPSGWLVCDGTEYSQTTYSALFAVLGSIYNTQTNPTTNAAWSTPTGGTFRVPDYRGVFLRSSGQASGQSSVTVGGNQLDAMQGHKHSITDTGHTHTLTGSVNKDDVNGGSTQGYFYGTGGIAATINSNTTGITVNSPSTDASGTPRTDTETRPINKGVLYIIKV